MQKDFGGRQHIAQDNHPTMRHYKTVKPIPDPTSSKSAFSTNATTRHSTSTLLLRQFHLQALIVKNGIESKLFVFHRRKERTIIRGGDTQTRNNRKIRCVGGSSILLCCPFFSRFGRQSHLDVSKCKK
jgi:hypothetical protein